MSRPIGTPEELERRRRLAVERVRQGEKPSVVARVLGINRTSLYRWRKAAAGWPSGRRPASGCNCTPCCWTSPVWRMDDHAKHGVGVWGQRLNLVSPQPESARHHLYQGLLSII